MSIDVRKDLRSTFGRARDQKRRPTCIAFAASDAHAFVRESPFQELSPEYAYYHAVKRKGIFSPDSGVTMGQMLDAIREDGQPLEAGWPYLEQLPTDLNAYAPPTGKGTVYRRSAFLESTVDKIVSALNEDRPVVIGMEISAEFYAPLSGFPVRAAVDSPTVGRHALVAAGYGLESGEQVLLVRNSWGSKWGDQGYAWLSRHYVEPRLISIGVFDK